MAWVVNNSYPYYAGTPAIHDFDPTFPSEIWGVADGHYPDKSTFLSNADFEAPYSSFLWAINTNKAPTLPCHLDTAMLCEPYPVRLWCVGGDDYPRRGSSLDVEPMGAFRNATDLSKIKIAYSVKSLGNFSFQNTNLHTVKINGECTYSDTTFPNECVVRTI